MFEFGRELKRILGAAAQAGKGLEGIDPSLMELMDQTILLGAARTATVKGGTVSADDRHGRYLEAAMCWREYARRTGETEAVRKAASAAESAGKLAQTRQQAAEAALEQALTCIAGSDLYDASELLTTAENLIAEGRSGAEDSLFLTACYDLAGARVMARMALGRQDEDLTLSAAAQYDQAIKALDAMAKASDLPRDRVTAALARTERADLLLAIGWRQSEVRIIGPVLHDLLQLMRRLSADYEPISYNRTKELCGVAHVYLGQLENDGEIIAEGVAMLSTLELQVNREHSPLDWVGQQHALALGLQALAEICDSDEAFDKAVKVFDAALEKPLAQSLSLRATVANNRAACLARRAERTGDLAALKAAENGFKSELDLIRPEQDPVSWAVIQSNLGRLYLAREKLIGKATDRMAAAYAFEIARDIFADHGLKNLADTAAEGLSEARSEGA